MSNQRKNTAENSLEEREILRNAYLEYMKFPPEADANDQVIRSFYSDMFGSYNSKKSELDILYSMWQLELEAPLKQE